MRMHDDQSFGMLKRCWGNFGKPLAFSIEANCRIICVTMVLKNYYIGRGDSLFGDTKKGKRERKERMKNAEAGLSHWIYPNVEALGPSSRPLHTSSIHTSAMEEI